MGGRPRIGISLLALLATSLCPVANAGVWDFVKSYQLGIEHSISRDQLVLNYEVDGTEGASSDSCKAFSGDSNLRRCSVSVASGGGQGFQLLAQKAFERQGFWHLDFDVNFGLRYLAGTISESKAQAEDLAPLESLRFSLGALLVTPSVTFGIAPANFWPDVLLSVGPALQIAAGSVAINDQSKTVVVGTSSGSDLSSMIRGHGQIEVVFWRFGDGALSVYFARDTTGGGNGTPFVRGNIDGMENIRAKFARTIGGNLPGGYGLKLLFDWP